ncbi:hypothetical protein [Lysinibacillus sphaericus]|uniref:hypothetical protein n=2 Tax=Bacillaceae TaxID=186817 RepID=UPI001E32CB0D|nr:hypothetical protein [Lysinibacillus sphaericus]
MSKVFAGLVVCGVLIFPGAGNSSAKEFNTSAAPESLNYLAEKTETLTFSALAQEQAYMDIAGYFPTYYGQVWDRTYTVQRNAPYAPAIYKGKLLYNASKSSLTSHWYEGRLILQNPL